MYMHSIRRLTAILSLALVLFGCQAEEKETFQWRLQSQAVETSIDFQQLLAFAKNIESMSQGRLTITPVPGGHITDGPDIYSAVSDGRIEMGNGWPNWWSAQHPAWAVMNAGPFDFMNLDASMIFFLAGEGTKLANELAAPNGVIWRPAWWPGMEFGLISREPIDGVAGLKGKRVRVGPGLPSEVLAEVGGAYTIPLVPSEIRPALENGDLDAVEWTTASGVLDLGLQDVSPHAIVPAIWQPSVLSDFLINKVAYESLPADLQSILETAIKAFTLTTTLKAKRADIEAFEKLKTSGVSIKKWSGEDIEAWRQASDRVLARYSAANEFNHRLIDAKRRFKQEFSEYYQWFGPYD